MRNELAELKAQKREIERKIKELETGECVTIGSTKIGKEHYQTTRPDRWYLAIEKDNTRYDGEGLRKTFHSIISAKHKYEIIDAIPKLINDLTALYNEVTNHAEE